MQNDWYRPSGATPTSHIFKLPMGRLGPNRLRFVRQRGKRMALPKAFGSLWHGGG